MKVLIYVIIIILCLVLDGLLICISNRKKKYSFYIGYIGGMLVYVILFLNYIFLFG
ncbi:MAG: hypothetical protein UE116_06290 [Clostridia bacterium]|mgnify:FL=1|jgi:hypothetical protein|nr:hypothetical protein [Clostridia bacterium]DAN60963.1 MAG TPA: dystroglycan [Caudoviricetes sp.]DAY69900.1 MAG TPA: dystroglycan [Caudoviricetes sp.]